MNNSIIRFILGHVLRIEGLLLFLPAIVSGIYHEHEGFYFVSTAAICLILGLAMTRKPPESQVFYLKEGCIATALSWILLSFFGCLPFYLSGEIPSLTDALFETVSGFTTTGASILDNVEGLSYCALFWRSFTHWIGGMGILSFMIAIIPKSESHSMYIMKAEVPGPKAGKVVSKIQDSARILYIIYCALTVIEIIVLYFFTKMRLFDAVTTAFSTAGTGGFSALNNSIAGYNSSLIEWIIIVFMFLFGVNFNLYFFILIRRFSSAFRNEELWTYVAVNVASILLITLSISNNYDRITDAIRDAAFNVNSIMTTTGFCTVDFDKWNTFSKVILVFLMFIGACVSSTGGGIKVTRIILYFKEMHADIKRTLKPNAITKIRMNGNAVEKKVIQGLNSYLVIYLGILVISTAIVSVNGFDFTSTLTSVITCLNNVGPGLGIVGPTGNYASFSVLSKLVFCFDMLAGRLELFPILILFVPRTYKK